MKKTVRLLAAMLMVLVLVLTFVACNDTDEPTTPDTTPDTHTTHTAGADWQKDATRHWHACTGNGCTEKLDAAVTFLTMHAILIVTFAVQQEQSITQQVQLGLKMQHTTGMLAKPTVVKKNLTLQSIVL